MLRSLYNISPGFIQRILYYINKKIEPVTRIPFKKSSKKPVFCFSWDCEIGLTGLTSRHKWKRGIFAREKFAVPFLLRLLDKHNIKSTWAICGKLFLTEEDLIKKIGKKHEIGCHGFSHINFSRCSRSVAKSEIKKSADLRKMKSFVFPYNDIKYLDLLEKYGFKNYRAKKESVGDAVKRGKLLEIPSSAHISYNRKSNKDFISIINKGIKNGGIIHFWSHPWNFVKKEDLIKLDKLFAYVRRKVNSGELSIKTMGEIK